MFVLENLIRKQRLGARVYLDYSPISLQAQENRYTAGQKNTNNVAWVPAVTVGARAETGEQLYSTVQYSTGQYSAVHCSLRRPPARM